MKPAKIIGGIFVTASVVCAGSVMSGYGVKQHQNKAARLAQQYKNTLNSLDIKAQYEKAHLQTISSIKKAIPQSDESLKIISKATK